MPNQNLLRSLDFTKSVGNRIAANDIKFNDASSVGGFPFEQKITGIQRVELFASGATSTDVIVGLKVKYTMEGGATKDVQHGIVDGVSSVGTVNLNESKVIVGVSGRIKNLPADPHKNKRISFVAFYVFNRDTGLVEKQGPFGNTDNVGDSWASLGPIIAFQGTRTDALGITSLGFVKLIQGVEGLGVYDDDN